MCKGCEIGLHWKEFLGFKLRIPIFFELPKVLTFQNFIAVSSEVFFVEPTIRSPKIYNQDLDGCGKSNFGKNY